MGEQLFPTTPDLLIQTFAEALMSPDADAVCGPEWLLDRRRRAEPALISVVATSYLLAFRRDAWRKLVEFLGITLLSQSQVSELAKDTPGKAVRIRPLRHCCTRPTTSPTGRCVRPVRSHPYRDQHSISGSGQLVVVPDDTAVAIRLVRGTALLHIRFGLPKHNDADQIPVEFEAAPYQGLRE